MKNRPWISIITVVFNNKDQIGSTIESVISQTCASKEFIVIDGGSTDGTLEIIKHYEKSVDVMVSEPDHGIYDAMNKGLKCASGEYILFLNSGDRFYDQETLLKISLMEPADVYYGETAFYNGPDQFIGLRSEVTTRKLPPVLDQFSFIMGMPVSHQSFIVSSGIAPMYDLAYTCSSDIDWCIRCLQKSKKVINTGLIISRYLIGGHSHKHQKKCWRERFIILREHFGWIRTILSQIRIIFRYLYKGVLLKRNY
jgi:glycosyltransferase involved in cell wall biosynthesis